MSNDITVSTVSSVYTGSDATGAPRGAADPQPQAEPAAPSSPFVNPTLRLDPALGLVVIEFRNDAGAITTSIPTQRQLEAYQRWEATRFGQAPSGEADGSAPTKKTAENRVAWRTESSSSTEGLTDRSGSTVKLTEKK